MPELLVDFITSLDGYASAEGWPGYWGLEGPEYVAWLDQSPERSYTTLMGATTYRLMSAFAATSDDDSFEQLSEMSKVVFSSLDDPLAWANTRLVDEDPVAAVRSLKAEAPVVTHDRQPHLVPVVARGWSRRPLPGGRLPRHHRQHRTGTDLRRVSRHRPRNDRQPYIRRQAAAARVRAHSPRRSTEQRSHDDLNRAQSAMSGRLRKMEVRLHRAWSGDSGRRYRRTRWSPGGRTTASRSWKHLTGALAGQRRGSTRGPDQANSPIRGLSVPHQRSDCRTVPSSCGARPPAPPAGAVGGVPRR